MLTGKELGQALQQAIAAKGVSKAQLARDFGVRGPSVYDWLEHGRIGKKHLHQLVEYFSDVLPTSHWGLSTIGEVAQIGTVAYAARGFLVPLLDVRGSMGDGGIVPDHIDVVKQIGVNVDQLRRQCSFTSPQNLNFITGYGNSMEPTFSDGDVLLVDVGVNEVNIDGVYVLHLNGKLYIKTLQRRPDGSVLMISDNKKYEPYPIKESDQIEVNGRVVLAWNARRL